MTVVWNDDVSRGNIGQGSLDVVCAIADIGACDGCSGQAWSPSFSSGAVTAIIVISLEDADVSPVAFDRACVHRNTARAADPRQLRA